MSIAEQIFWTCALWAIGGFYMDRISNPLHVLNAIVWFIAGCFMVWS